MLLVLFLLLAAAAAQDNECEIEINLERLENQVLQSPNYPQDDEPGTDCIWIITSPPGTRIKIQCPPSNIDYHYEKLNYCGSYFYVLRSLSEQVYYCRNHKEITETSESNQMSLVYSVIADGEPSEHFSCALSVEEVPEEENNLRRTA